MSARPDPELTLGIDIGGTKIAVGLVDRAGAVVRRAQTTTPTAQGREAIVAAARDLAVGLGEGLQPLAVGIGAAGVVVANRVRSATDLLPGWVGTDLGTAFAGLGRSGRVVAVNDVHAHGVGEAWRGAAAGYADALVVAVGTGLGGVVVHDGLPLSGAHGAAGHLGHVRSVDAAGLPCSCGVVGHLEAVTSGYGIAQLYRSLGGDPAVTTSREVAERAGQDPVVGQALTRAGAALGRVLGDLLNVLDPGVVVVSGSVSRAGEDWWQAVRDGVHETVLDVAAATPLVRAGLGDDAGVVGAARLAQRKGDDER